MLGALRCAVEPKTAIYLSGPITTGRKYVEWHALSADTRPPLRSIQEDNEAELVTLAKELRIRTGLPVIQPASLRVPEWNQESYYSYWKLVIDRFAVKLVMVEDWQFSVGCAVEFAHALNRDILVESWRGDRIDALSGKAFIEDAIRVTRNGNRAKELARLASGLEQAIGTIRHD